MSRKFYWGVGLIVFSSVLGWVGLAAGGALAAYYRSDVYAKLGGAVWGFSWVILGVGVLLAGRDGIDYSKNLFKKLKSMFRRQPGPPPGL